MNDRIWAGIGKIGAFLGVVISLILGVLRLYDRIAGPSLEAATEMVQPVPSKSIKRLVENEIEHQRIIADIEKRRSSGEPADLTLKSVEADLKKATLPKDDFLAASLEQFSPRQVLELTVWNHGGDVARSVEIMMPGSGTAQISELGSLQTETTLQWTHSVQLGDLPPGATLIVRIWTDNSALNLFWYMLKAPGRFIAGGNSLAGLPIWRRGTHCRASSQKRGNASFLHYL